MFRRLRRGRRFRFSLTAKIDDGWHIYSRHYASADDSVSRLRLDDPAAHVFQPKPEEKFDEALGANAEFYEKEAIFWVPFELKKDAAAGPLEITAQVRYAACDAKRCLPPKKKQASFTLTVDAVGARVRGVRGSGGLYRYGCAG